ncbi:Cleavage and polyadenylation specificity factor subunit 6 [Linum grandiflorum]
MADDKIDFEDEEYGSAQKLQYQGSGTIPALAEEEMDEDDEYDDLYNDVNVGENFLQMHRSDPPAPPANASNGTVQSQNAPESKLAPDGGGAGSQGAQPGVAADPKYSNPAPHFQEEKEVPGIVKGPVKGSVDYPDESASQEGKVMDMAHDTQVGNMGFRGPAAIVSNIAVNPSDMTRKVPIEPPSMPSVGTGNVTGVPQMPSNHMNINMDASAINENQIRPPIQNGSTMLFVGELHWWTTDAEVESVCSQYGRVKEIKFYDEKASGKSKGYCQVEFYEAASAASCKEGMNGFLFNGRACVVAFASPQTIKQMGASYTNKNQNQPQAQTQGRRPMNDGAGRGGSMNFPAADGGRNFGRGGGWGRGAPGVLGGPIRGRGGMGGKGMLGGAAGVGGGLNGGGYGQGFGGPAFGGPGGMMPPHAMMGAGFDAAYMGRGAGYGGFGGGPGFPGMLPSFPDVNTMGLAGVAPHVNPAFFGRGMAPNAMGMMGASGMEGPGMGMWSETSMGGWGEEHGRKTRESSYGAEDGASDYGYGGEANQEKGGRSSAAPREKERSSARDMPGASDRRHRDEREQDWDRSERDHRESRYKEEKDSYRDHRKRDRDSGYEDDWDRGQSSSRQQSRSRAVPDDHRSRSRDAEYGKRRRVPSD